MRHFLVRSLIVAAVVGVGTAAAAEGGGSSEPTPTLEYRPPRRVTPEPRAPTPPPPVTVFRESIGSFGIGTGSFDGPVDVAFDADGNFYVLDKGNNRVQMYDNFSNFKRTWGSNGSRTEEFRNPSAIVVDSTRVNSRTRRVDYFYIFVLDSGNNRVQIFQHEKLTGKTVYFESWGGLGSRDGDFKDPRDIVLDGKGDIWVLDAGNERVQRFTFDPEKTVGSRILFAESWGRAFGSRGGKFEGLVSLAWSRDRREYIYLLGAGCVVQQFQMDGTFVNSWPAVAPESGLCSAGRIEIDNKNDYVYILDSGNGLFERFNLEGRLLFAMRGAERPFSNPLGLAVNPDRDELLVADTDNNIVQKFTLR